MIKKCDCKHPGQDKLHGKGKRVFNETKGSNNNPGWRCTVCTKEVLR